MFEPATAYVVAIFAMSLAGFSALALIHTVRHFDTPEPSMSHERRRKEVPEQLPQEVTV